MSILSLTIPASERRAMMRSFWVMLGLLAATLWAALAWTFGAPELAAGAVALLAAAVLIALVRENAAWRVYRAWNRRLVLPLTALSRRVALRMCFFIVTAASRTGSSPPSGDDGATRWRPRGALGADAYRALFASAQAPGGARRAWASYLSWARQTGNLWAVALIPYLAILRWLPREEEAAEQGNIYTLF